MTEQIWHTIIVRAWRDRDGLKIRFMSEDARTRPPNIAVESTVEAAAARFDEWLKHATSTAENPRTPSGSEEQQRDSTRSDDEATTSEKTSAS